MEEVDGHSLEWLLAKPSVIGLCYQDHDDNLIDMSITNIKFYLLSSTYIYSPTHPSPSSDLSRRLQSHDKP